MSDTQEPIKPEDYGYDFQLSKTFLDYCKNEVDISWNVIRLFEERARTNVTVAAAVLPVMGFIRSQKENSLEGLGLLLSILMALVLIVVIWTYILIIKPQDSVIIKKPWLNTQREAIYNAEVQSYTLMYELQQNWINQIENLGSLRREKLKYLSSQIIALAVLYFLLIVYVICAIILSV